MPETLLLERQPAVARVVMNRPDVRNALNAAMIVELTAAFRELGQDSSLRAVVLLGAGKAFSGGADVQYMRESLDLTPEQNYRDALGLSDMFSAIDDCPVPVVAGVQGAALGGGSGLLAVCDAVISADDALFGFTEAKLGIVPAVISPFVLGKIGQSNARALFPTAERFGAERALRIGLVHAVVPAAELHAAVERTVAELLSSGPQAARAAKRIARVVPGLASADAREWTATEISERRTSAEGQEGLRAFLDKRAPLWR